MMSQGFFLCNLCHNEDASKPMFKKSEVKLDLSEKEQEVLQFRYTDDGENGKRRKRTTERTDDGGNGRQRKRTMEKTDDGENGLLVQLRILLGKL